MPVKRKPVNRQAFQGNFQDGQQSYQETGVVWDDANIAGTKLSNAETWPQSRQYSQPITPDSHKPAFFSAGSAEVSALEESLANLEINKTEPVQPDVLFAEPDLHDDTAGSFTTEPAELDDDVVLNPEVIRGPDEPVSASPGTTRGTRLLAALDTTAHYLGSLLPHPTVSTKHHTILRHSHGLVYYRGPETSLAITIFADQPIPNDRRLWLQTKGWTGKTGMRAKALFRTNSSWINVTPEREVQAEHLNPRDERAWQRDIQKFTERLPKPALGHACRETCVLRIPFEAVDGYFRLVLTTSDSRSVLCPSPVFRVASTSMSASSVKGASLSTLPIELAVKIAQFTGRMAAKNALTPVLGAAKQQVVAAVPGAQNLSYARTAYQMSGMQITVDDMEEQHLANSYNNVSKGGAVAVDRYEPMPRPGLVGDDTGPEVPYPLRLKGTISRGSGRATKEFGMPTANLDSVPLDLIAPVRAGVYFGWALVTPREKGEDDLHADWRQTIVSIAVGYSEKALVAQRKVVRAYLLHDFPPNSDFVGARLELVVMGWLRPLLSTGVTEVIFAETVRDIEITQASLDREQWGPQETLRRIKTENSQRSVTDRVVQVRSAGQRQVNRVPVHKLGVRNDSFGAYDRGLYGNGGVFVRRG